MISRIDFASVYLGLLTRGAPADRRPRTGSAVRAAPRNICRLPADGPPAGAKRSPVRGVDAQPDPAVRLGIPNGDRLLTIPASPARHTGWTEPNCGCPTATDWQQGGSNRAGRRWRNIRQHSFRSAPGFGVGQGALPRYDSEAETTQPLFFLRHAFQETRQQVVQVISSRPRDGIPSGAADSATLFVVTDSLSEGQAKELHTQVSNGKAILFAPKSAASAQVLKEWIGASTLQVEDVKAANYAMLGEINFRHPLFEPFAEPRFSDFTKIHFWNYQRLGDPRRSPSQGRSLNSTTEIPRWWSSRSIKAVCIFWHRAGTPRTANLGFRASSYRCCIQCFSRMERPRLPRPNILLGTNYRSPVRPTKRSSD